MYRRRLIASIGQPAAEIPPLCNEMDHQTPIDAILIPGATPDTIIFPRSLPFS